jgi:hypothetical protein
MADKRSSGAPILRLLTAAGLGVDAYVHINLAPRYHAVTGSSGISQELLFRIEGGVAILVALIVLAGGSRFLQFVAFLVAASALAAVLVYRYTNVGAIGPFPNMHDPAWFPEKTLSAWAEAVAALTALALVLTPRRVGPRQRKPKGSFKPYS